MRNTLQLTFAVLLLILCKQTLFAQGTLMVEPKRVLFENNKRTDDVTLYNSGSDTTSYFISFKHFDMLENGKLQDVDTIKTNTAFADSLIRFFPRGVRLAPHTSQTVRLQFTKPQFFSSGEYRTHLYIVEAEPTKAIDPSLSESDKSISLNIHALVGVAIPIIIRYQTKPSQVFLWNLTLSEVDTGGRQTATFEMDRTGEESCYGNLLLTYTDPFGKSLQLSETKGTGIYVPLEKRIFAMTFKPPKGIKIEKGGTLKVEYRSTANSGKEAKLATTDLLVSN